VLRIDSSVTGNSFIMSMKFYLPSTASSTGVSARTVAFRGAFVINAISPKYCPLCSFARNAPLVSSTTSTSPALMK
jgi:hypothetical protein